MCGIRHVCSSASAVTASSGWPRLHEVPRRAIFLAMELCDDLLMLCRSCKRRPNSICAGSHRS